MAVNRKTGAVISDDLLNGLRDPAFSRNYDVCLLCGKKRYRFNCSHCIKRGSFVHSQREYRSERFSDKQIKLWQMRGKQFDIHEQCQIFCKKRYDSDKIKNEIKAHEEKIFYLHAQITRVKTKIAYEKFKMEKIHKLNLSKMVDFSTGEQLRKNLETKMEIDKEKNEKKKIVLLDRQNDIEGRVRELVRDLVHYIFPITEVQHNESFSDEDEELSTRISELAEACRTAYVKGRWISTDQSGELQYQIVEPRLPANGDYSTYATWLSENKNLPMSGSGQTMENSKYTIAGALTYFTQLVNIVANILGVYLPVKLEHTAFCDSNIQEDAFSFLVACLNANVVHLCITQHVDPKLVESSTTVKNFLHLIKSSKLGRISLYDFDDPLFEDIEIKLQDDFDKYGKLVQYYGIGEDNEPDTDWENIQIEDAYFNIPTVPAYPTPVRSRARSNSAGNLMSNVVTKFKKWAIHK